MKNADELFVDLEIYRSKKEMDEYFNYIYDCVHSDKEYGELTRIKKGKFKEFLEEFCVLRTFSKSRFCDDMSEMKIVVGNQGYDALIKNGDTLRKIEFTKLVDGRWEHKAGENLNKNGISQLRFDDVKSLDKRSSSYMLQILKNAEKKSVKDYMDVEIVIVVDTYTYFEVYDNSSVEFVETLRKYLSDMPFNAKKVYLLASVFNSENVDDKLFEVN